jgi:tetratricopeptide (TPR) repeat protein
LPYHLINILLQVDSARLFFLLSICFFIEEANSRQPKAFSWRHGLTLVFATLPYFVVLAWFITSLLSALGLVDLYTHRYSAGYSLVYDHFQYLAGMAPLALAAASIVRLTGASGSRSRWLRPLTAALLLLLLGAASWQRIWAFQSNQTLWTDAVAGNPQCWSCHYSLGVALLADGKADAAFPEFQKPVELNPGFAEAHNNLGLSPKASHLQQVLAIDPRLAEPHDDLGIVYAQSRQFAAATTEFQAALRLNPDDQNAHDNLSRVETADAQLAAAQHPSRRSN